MPQWSGSARTPSRLAPFAVLTVRPTTSLRSASLVFTHLPTLRTQPLDGGQGDDKARHRAFALPFDLQASLARQVAHGALAHTEHPGRFPGPNVPYFPLSSDVCSFP